MSGICEKCNKLFATQSNLNRHTRNVHKTRSKAVQYHKSVWSSKCLEGDCNKSFKENKALITHLTEEHNKTFECTEISLKDMDEFHSWKSTIEKETKSRYLFKRTLNSAVGVTIYYNCNRSNQTRNGPRDKNKQYKRSLKSQGSCKMSSRCTSEIKVITKAGNDIPSDILIQWQKTHYGHTIDLQHIRLSLQDRLEVAAKLIRGLTPRKILETTRDGIENELKRLDLLTSKDICNIKDSFNIEVADGKRHVNGAISDDLWVQECYSEDNPVLFYKNQGEISDILAKNERDESIERIEIVKGKNTGLSRNIFDRHNKALTLDYKIETYERHWKIFKKSGDFYTVIKLSDTKCCEEYCSACNICKHMYSCTCQDFEETFIICKHIHYIHFNPVNNTTDHLDVKENNVCVTPIVQSIKSNPENFKLNSMINSISYKLKHCEFEKLNDGVIQQITYHLKIVNDLLTLPKYNEKEILQNKNVFKKKYIEPQLGSTTKRKREM